MMDHGHEITWLSIINTFVSNLPATLTSLAAVLGAWYAINRKINTAQESVNKNVGEVKKSVEENTDITANMPSESAARIEHKLTNGLGDHLAAKTAAALQPTLIKAADKVAEVAKVNTDKIAEVAKDTADKVAQNAAAKGDELRQIATDVVVAERSSGVAAKAREEGVAEGIQKGIDIGYKKAMAEMSRKAAETDQMIPIPKPKQG